MSVSRNVVWNTAGMLVPMLVAVLAVPTLVNHLGTVRFGVLSIAWALVGYFGVLDLGLGRALTHAVAGFSADTNADAMQAALIRRATWLMVSLGVIWAIILASLAGPLSERWLTVPSEMTAETGVGLWLLALAVPFVMFVNARLAVLEGLQRFPQLNAIRIPLGACVVLAPTAIAMVTPRLDAVLGALVAVRVVAALSLLPWSISRQQITPVPPQAMRELLRFGGWLSVTNLVGPLITYCDRFYIAAAMGASAVTFYVVPYDVLVRLTAFPLAMLAVFFPLMSTVRVHDHARLIPALLPALRLLDRVWLPALALSVLLGRDVLALWVGQIFVSKSTLVWSWLSIGVFANGLAFLPYNLIQSMGRTDLTAKLHLIELPIYFGLLYVGIHFFGLAGAAAAWSLRAVLDAVLLYGVSLYLSAALRPQMWRGLLSVVVGVCLLGLMATLESRSLRWPLAAVIAALPAWTLWRVGMNWRIARHA